MVRYMANLHPLQHSSSRLSGRALFPRIDRHKRTSRRLRRPTMYRTLALLLLSLSPATALADACPWMQPAELDALWPNAAPWKVMVGGPGSCKFTSDPTAPANIVGANQMIKATAAEAESFVASMKESMAKSYEVAARPSLGKAAFSYRPKPGSGMAERSLYFVAHQANVAVIVSMTMQAPVTPGDEKAGEAFARAALALGDDTLAQAEAIVCPWFNPAVLAKLLPGPDRNQQQFGNTSCMAQAGGAAVIVSIIDNGGPALLSRVDGGCSAEPVPELGDSASVLDCASGRPHAKVRYAQGARVIEYSYAPGRAPTADERALLIELAVKAPARR